MKVQRIGILGHYGNENLGDEAIITACVQSFRTCMPSAEIRLFSAKPDDSETRHCLKSFPIRHSTRKSLTPSEQLARNRNPQVNHAGTLESGAPPSESGLKEFIKTVPFAWQTLRWLKELPRQLCGVINEVKFLILSRTRVKPLSLLIVAGSNQFLDNFGGAWGFPYTLLKWTLLARSAGVPVVYVSVGAGPLDSPLSRRMVRLALRLSSHQSFRDEASRALVYPHDHHKGKVFPDLAFAVTSPKTRVEIRTSVAGLVIAVNPMPVYDARYWYIKDPVRYRQYVEKLAAFVSNLIEQGHSPRLFPTQPKDENVVDDINRGLLERGHNEQRVHELFTPLKSVSDLLSFLESVDIVVPTRFHGTVLGLWAGKPVVGICYYRKTADLLASFGQGRFAFDLDHVTVGDLSGAVDEISDDRASISLAIQEHRDQCRRLLEQQFESVSAMASQP